MIKIDGNTLDIHGDKAEIIMQMYHLFSALLENNAEILAALFLTFEDQLRTKVDNEDELRAACNLMELIKKGEDRCR